MSRESKLLKITRMHVPLLWLQQNILLLKSYNVPELTKRPIQVSRETLEQVIHHTEAELATYKE